MATLSPTSISRTGVARTLAAAAGGGDQFLNTGYEYLEVANDGVGSITVTITTQNTSDGLAVTDRTVTVANGAAKLIGPFPPSIYNDSSGYVQVAYSGVTSVTVAVWKLTPVPGQ